MSFSAYMIGFVVLTLGLALAAYLLNVPAKWIGVGVITLVGLGIVKAVSATRERDPSR
ncbi:MAG: hypothetical protein IT158_18645 [Bryobacterales bacterium]|nr:hypothetical protein [Bryobacterales bacterium]